MLHTDTDSLIVEVETEDIYKNMYEHKEDYDFSEYPENSPYYNIEDKRVVDKFNYKYKGVNVSVVYANTHTHTHTHMYKTKALSVLIADDKEINKAECVQNSVVKKYYHLNLYKECVLNSQQFRYEQTFFRSHNHQIGIYKQTKKTLFLKKFDCR